MIDTSTLPKSLFDVCIELRNAGFQAWLVGGAVRDLLMRRAPHDFDIATDARPDQIEEVFNKHYCHTVDTGKKHGTITVFYTSIYDTRRESRDSYEVTTFRTESGYSDGRHPDSVQFASQLDHDLERRDFTMNAIAYDPLYDTLRDPFNGQVAIFNDKQIDCVGDPLSRFKEDGLRCLRAIRFSAQLGFKIERYTLSCILPSIESFKKVSPERVSQELVKLFSSDSDRCAVAFTYLISSGIVDVIFPEMVDMIDCEQNCYHSMDVMNHTICVMSHVRNDAPVHVKLAALFHDIGKPKTKTVHPKRGDAQFLGHEEVSADMTYEIMTRLKFSNELRDKVCHLIRHHLVMYESKWSNATIRRWVRRVGSDNVGDLLDLYRADILGKGNAKVKQATEPLDELIERIKKLGTDNPIVTSTNKLPINGQDVMNLLGLKPGKAVGDILKACLEAVTDDPELNDREKLLTWIVSGPQVWLECV